METTKSRLQCVTTWTAIAAYLAVIQFSTQDLVDCSSADGHSAREFAHVACPELASIHDTQSEEPSISGLAGGCVDILYRLITIAQYRDRVPSPTIMLDLAAISPFREHVPSSMAHAPVTFLSNPATEFLRIGVRLL